MGLVIEGKPVTGKVSVSEGKNGQSEVEQKVGEAKVDANNYATVGYRMGHTKNLGNYESLRVEVSIHWPCSANIISVDETYAKCKEWVENRMEAVIKEVDDL